MVGNGRRIEKCKAVVGNGREEIKKWHSIRVPFLIELMN